MSGCCKNECISLDRIFEKLDAYFHDGKYDAAERHLLYWLAEAKSRDDARLELPIRNELMGMYRKLGREQDAVLQAREALETVQKAEIGHQVGAATTYLNVATVYKAFGKSEQAISLFAQTQEIYERELEPNDSRLGGLYNNMALALVDLNRYQEANDFYEKAVAVMSGQENGKLEVAITYLNMASAAEAEKGLEAAEPLIECYLQKAEDLLEAHPVRDGYYAFVCDKCATVFDYYGRFFFANELKKRAERKDRV